MIKIRRLTLEGDLLACVDLQRQVWLFETQDLVTPAMLRTCTKAGGIVLGAFQEGCLIGFAFSFPAVLAGEPIQHSHMLAVSETQRNRGIGRLLKEAQFREATKVGCTRVTWTFEPLESRNAFLNLQKLGATARRYYIDLYGESTSSILHAGLGTDRLLVEKDLTSECVPPGGRVPLREALQLAQAIRVEKNPEGWIVPAEVQTELAVRTLAAEIPSDIQLLKQSSPAAARAWREAMRKVMCSYLQRGYQVSGVLLAEVRDEPLRRCFYILDCRFRKDSRDAVARRVQ